jgi:hypothetical protein
MMNKEQIAKLVTDNFKISNDGGFDVDDEGVVHVTAQFIRISNRKLTQIPVQFGTVSGSFVVTSSAIHSLQGCPRVVMGTFSCDGCMNITSLEGGPQTVHEYYDCAYNSLTSLKGCATTVRRMLDVRNNPLTSLEGLTPGVAQIRLNWDPDLPLLRVLELPEGFQIPSPDQQPWDRSEPPWEKILEPYAGSGKKGALAAAAELIRAGYKGNARW